MENNELKLNEGPSIFSEEEYADMKANYGITDEEIETLRDANALVTTAKLVPDDADKMFAKYDKIFAGKNATEAMKTFFELAEKDPKFLVQLVSAIELAEQVSEDAPAKIEKVSLTEVAGEQSAEETENFENFVADALDAFRKLSPEDKSAVMAELKKR